jgi:hypothetical protein
MKGGVDGVQFFNATDLSSVNGTHIHAMGLLDMIHPSAEECGVWAMEIVKNQVTHTNVDERLLTCRLDEWLFENLDGSAHRKATRQIIVNDPLNHRLWN